MLAEWMYESHSSWGLNWQTQGHRLPNHCSDLCTATAASSFKQASNVGLREAEKQERCLGQVSCSAPRGLAMQMGTSRVRLMCLGVRSTGMSRCSSVPFLILPW